VSVPALDWLRDLDRRATTRLRAIPMHALGRAALSLVAHSGDSLVLIPAFALLWWAGRFSHQSIAVPLAIGYLASVPVTAIVKYTVRRRRPEGEWGSIYRKTDPHSFPSGHASRTITLSVIVLAGNEVLAGTLLVVWSLAVGFARIALGVHFLLDILAGYLLGLAVGLALWPWIARGMPGLPQFPWGP
jgi:membrane-associated phospholipid phosphatase